MAVTAGTAFIDIRGDFTKFDRDIDRHTRGTHSKFAAIGKAAAIGFGAGIGGAALAVKGFANAAIEAQKSQARMQTQLKASGISYKAHAKQIDDVIQRVSKLSGLDDEDLQDSFTNIVRVTGDVNKSLKLTGLAADFARAKHMDVAKAGEIVAKVAGGNTGILARYGIQIDKGASSTEALGALQQKFAGQAKAYGETTAGAQDRFGVAVENLQETLGQKLLPVLANVANAAASFINGLQTGEGVGQKVRDVFGQVREKVSGLGETFQGLIDIGKVLWGAFGSTIVDSLEDTGKAFVKFADAAMKVLKGVVDFVAGVFTGDWGRAWDGIKSIFGGVWEAMVALVRLAWERVKTVVNLAMTAVIAVIKGFGSALGDAGEWVINRVADGIKTVTGAFAAVGGWVKNRVVDLIQAQAEGITAVGGWVINRVADGIKVVTNALSSVGGWVKNRVVELIQMEGDGLTAVGSWVLNRVIDGVRTVTDALSGVGGWIKNRIVELVHDAGDGFASLGGWIVDKIVGGLKAGANALVGFVNDIIDIINKIPGVEIGHVKGFRAGGSTDELPAFAQGGVTHHDRLAQGGTITRPMMVVGEEAPKHPEFIIPTNPAYRGRAVGLFGQLGKQLGIPGFALGGLIGGLPGTDGLGWLKGTGSWLLGKVTGFIKNKLSDALGAIFTSSFDAGDIKKVLARLAPMAELMDRIASRHYAYSYGGGHNGAFAPSSDIRGNGNFGYDCSGLVSAILHAGGFLGSPMSTDGLKTFGDAGDGKYITIGVRGSTGLNAHTMMKIGNKYLESGGGHGAQWVSGWDGNFPIHRHPAGFAMGGIVAEEILKRLQVGDGGLGWGLARGGVVGPYVGAYKMGGVVPRDGMAYVHAGETITPADRVPEVRVFIGETELHDIVRVEIDERNRASGAFFRAGSLA